MLLPPLRTGKLHSYRTTNCSDYRSSSPPNPLGRAIGITTGSKINPDLSLTFEVFRIEVNFQILLLPSCFYKKRVTKIVVMEMEGRFVIAIPISPYNLAI